MPHFWCLPEEAGTATVPALAAGRSARYYRRAVSGLEFRVLGPLEISEGGQARPLAGTKQKALLAALLLHPGEAVSSDRLVEALWGEEPPEKAQNALQAHVSQLRKVLGSAAGELVTQAPGYVLRISPEQLDAARFERLATEGRRALADGDPRAGADTLREALSLWHGPALADLAYEAFAQEHIARLEEARLAALEDRLEADLEVGRHGEIVAELEALTATHPFRERLRCQLMLALYRSGRQAEALAVYQGTRMMLSEELGLEPGPQLRELNGAILNQSPALTPRVEAPTIAERPIVRSEAAPGPAVEERKIVTLLFADLVGSTEFGDRQDPERTRAVLERFYDAAAAEVELAGGTVEKFVGDAVMAVFGAPAAHEDHAERALHAALALRNRLDEVVGEMPPVRIGVDAGEVVLGRAREGSSFMTGDAVNVAARLEQLAGPGEILVGERAVAVVRGAFEFEDKAIVGAKGEPQGVACRRLVRGLSLARPRGVGGLRRSFVGRGHELELLLATHRRTTDQGASHLVTVMGDAGVGKTRLVRELWERLGDGTPAPLRLAGRCLAYGRGITYWPLAEVLKEHLRILESDPPEAVVARLGEREVLGLALGLDVAGGLHPLEAQAQLHEGWVGWLEELVSERPTVVLVEDLHWAEAPLLDVLERVLREVRGPLLLVATARPELLDRRPGWGGGRRNATTLWLEPLQPSDSSRLLDDLLGSELPLPLRELVLGRAEGNPFFLEELIGTLIGRGILERAGDGWITRGPPSDFVVPDSVQAVLASRIDLLPIQEKAALQAASVIGRVFWPGPVRELIGGAEPNYALLEERDFVRRSSGTSLPGEREYAIKHALTREVAYASIPRARRAPLHAFFAEWLERVGEGGDEHAPFLAHHYAEATSPEDVDLAWAGEDDEYERLRAKALTWLDRAADLAVGRYEIDDALRLLQRANELERDVTAQAERWLEIGRANALKFDGAGFQRALEQAIALSTDQRLTRDASVELAYAAKYGMWRQRPDARLVDGWLDRALELTEGEEGAERVKALCARVWWDPLQEWAAVEASRIAQHLGTAEELYASGSALQEVARAAGRYDEAISWASSIVRLLPELTDPDSRGFAHWGAVVAHLGAGNLDDARRHALHHDEIVCRLTPHHVVHGFAISLLVEEHAGRWEEIRTYASRVEPAVAGNADAPCVLNPRMLLLCALAAAHEGDQEEARRLEQAAEAVPMEGYGLTIDAVRIRLALIRGDLDTVARLIELPVGLSYTATAAQAARLDGLAALRDRQRVEAAAAPLVQPGTYLEPFALRALGVAREDVTLVEQAQARFEEMGLDWHAAQTRALL